MCKICLGLFSGVRDGESRIVIYSSENGIGIFKCGKEESEKREKLERS